MHTSTRLRTADFQYRTLEAGKTLRRISRRSSRLSPPGPGWRCSPGVAEGILYTGYTLLALTTPSTMLTGGGTDFSTIRSTSLCWATLRRLPTRIVDETWAIWRLAGFQLDPGSEYGDGMLEKAFALQINRLFWPKDSYPRQGPVSASYMRRDDAFRLKAVHFYQASTMEIRAAHIENVMQYSRTSADGQGEPQPDGNTGAGAIRMCSDSPGGSEYFLAMMNPCFVRRNGINCGRGAQFRSVSLALMDSSVLMLLFVSLPKSLRLLGRIGWTGRRSIAESNCFYYGTPFYRSSLVKNGTSHGQKQRFVENAAPALPGYGTALTS